MGRGVGPLHLEMLATITDTTQGQRRNEPAEFGGQIIGSWGEVIENLDLKQRPSTYFGCFFII